MELIFKNTKRRAEKKMASKKVCEIQLEPQEFAEIYEMYYRRVYNYISYRINNHCDTEDLVSQVFSRVIQKYHTYDQHRAVFEAWIIGIARNTVTDYFRSRKNNTNVSLDKIVDFLAEAEKDQPDTIMVRNQNNRALMKALNILNDRERNMIALKYAGELKNTDIAKLMHISETNVGVILFRSLKKLRKELESEV